MLQSLLLTIKRPLHIASICLVVLSLTRLVIKGIGLVEDIEPLDSGGLEHVVGVALELLLLELLYDIPTLEYLVLEGLVFLVNLLLYLQYLVFQFPYRPLFLLKHSLHLLGLLPQLRLSGQALLLHTGN